MVDSHPGPNTTPKIGFLRGFVCIVFVPKKQEGMREKLKARKEEDAKRDYFALKRGIRELY